MPPPRHQSLPEDGASGSGGSPRSLRHGQPWDREAGRDAGGNWRPGDHSRRAGGHRQGIVSHELPFGSSRDHLPKRGATLKQPDPKPLKMDEFPLPAFHLLPMDLYHYEVLGKNFCLFEMSRGCASDCTFCLLKPYGIGVRKKVGRPSHCGCRARHQEFRRSHRVFHRSRVHCLTKQAVSFAST